MTEKLDRNWTKSKTAGQWQGGRTPQEIRDRRAKCWAKFGHEFFDLCFGKRLKSEEKAVVIALAEQLYRFGNGRHDTRQFVVGTRTQLAEASGLSNNGAWAALKSLEQKQIALVQEVGHGKYRLAFTSSSGFTSAEARQHEELVRQNLLERLELIEQEAATLGFENWRVLSTDRAFLELLDDDYWHTRGIEDRKEILLKYGTADNMMYM